MRLIVYYAILTDIYYPHIVRIYIGRRVDSQDTPAAPEQHQERQVYQDRWNGEDEENPNGKQEGQPKPNTTINGWLL